MNVKIYDFSTKTVTEIPASELSPDYTRVRIDNVDGEVFVNAEEIKCSTEFKHPPFDDETRAVFASFSETFADVLPKSVEEWEDGFRMDLHAHREIEIWKKIAAAYRHFTYQKKVPSDAKADYLRIILSCANNGCAAALEVVQLRRLSKARARGVVREIKEMFMD